MHVPRKRPQHLALAPLAAAGERGVVADQQQRIARVFANLEAHGDNWYWECDRAGRITYLSQRMQTLLAERGLAAEGRRITDLFQPAQIGGGGRRLADHLERRSGFSEIEVRIAGIAEERSWVLSGRPWQEGERQGFVGTGSDLTERHRAEAEAARLTMQDPLTGLANRAKMNSLLEQAFAAGRGRSRTSVLMMLDLDRFKQVNDSFGHPTGDELLRRVGERLRRDVGDAGVVGRLGGDEFQILLPDECRFDFASMLARRLIRSLGKPFQIEGVPVAIGASIGIALAPEHADNPQDLVRNADLALYAAKAGGSSSFSFYREQMLESARERKVIEDGLRGAIERSEFHLVFQPVVRTWDEHIVGYEALLRWTHPERGAIPPVQFIPIAEDSGLIEQIGGWVLEQACATALGWPPHVRIAVNVSAVQFLSPGFVDVVRRTLKQTGLAPARLELEMTESVFVEDPKRTEEVLHRLSALGIRLALDDFGTGYSSLGYLKSAPYNKIKIDQSFVRGAKDPTSRNGAIISAIVRLAREFGMETTAEGVEDLEELQLVRRLEVSHIQGFLYGKPRTAEQVLRLDSHVAPAKTRAPRAASRRRA